MSVIYVSLLECNKYFVGKIRLHGDKEDCEQIKEWLNFHQDNYEWVRMYECIEVLGILYTLEPSNRNIHKIMVDLMSDHGIHNVRSILIPTLHISNTDVTALKNFIELSTKKCYNCGRTSHYHNTCQHLLRDRHSSSLLISNYLISKKNEN